jgi:hypothetical protein
MTSENTPEGYVRRVTSSTSTVYHLVAKGDTETLCDRLAVNPVSREYCLTLGLTMCSQCRHRIEQRQDNPQPTAEQRAERVEQQCAARPEDVQSAKEHMTRIAHDDAGLRAYLAGVMEHAYDRLVSLHKATCHGRACAACISISIAAANRQAAQELRDEMSERRYCQDPHCGLRPHRLLPGRGDRYPHELTDGAR